MARKTKGFWTLDAETDPFSIERNVKNEIPQPFLWGALHYPSEEYVEFKTVDEVARFFEDKAALVYAHNGGKFDYHYLREFINSDEPILVIGGRLAKFRIGNSEFRDSMNLFQHTKLEKFGGKIKIDYAKFEPAARADPNTFAEIKNYLRADNQVLQTALQSYFDKYGKSLTQAGASMKYWQTHFDQVAPRQSMAEFQKYKPYYYGGRVQAFVEGVRSIDFKVCDVNSAYPRAMREKHAFSTCAVQRDHLPPMEQLYRCLIRLTCSARGCFPWKDGEGAMYFPEDGGRAREYFVTGWELLTALATGSVTKVNIREVHYFTETVNFREYIDFFYEERMRARAAGDTLMDIFAKYFMNSLYGKFGQDVDNHSEYVIASEDSLENWLAKGYLRYKRWGDRHLMTKPCKLLAADSIKRRYYNIATAASITGFQRAYLFRSMHQCSGLLYCDTDSLAARDTAALPMGNALGEWKLERECDQYAIAGKKMYAFHGREPGSEIADWKVACKGVDLSAEDIIKVANGETIEYIPEVPTYSITREVPRYINRNVMKTFKDISRVN